ncbi:MAG: hypothetical protein LBS36_05520 [Oscillospiraceae bacterium]|jgi:hypothetical protein|nr:hypothetical protein [Oscillospiraceae bacterium]
MQAMQVFYIAAGLFMFALCFSQGFVALKILKKRMTKTAQNLSLTNAQQLQSGPGVTP